MKKLIPILLVFLAFYATQCGKSSSESATQSEKTHEVIVYGSMTCDHCIDFLKKADSLSVKYTFKDVETNTEYYNELVKKIQEANYQGYVSFPVIEVDGSIYVNPEFQKFQALIK
ncbi:MAG: glutaredoxin family protein [Cyclobacteriaceae bacterium]|nr:glutaredoxin family protein [Cyclobacteriaceae bacterium]